MYCPSCGTFNEDNNFRCIQCGNTLPQQGAQGQPQQQPQQPQQPVQPGYAMQQQAPAYPQTYGQKSRVVAGILQIFLGSFGAGRFYLGYTGMAVAQIAVTWLTCGIGGLWPFIDGIMMLTGTPATDANGNPLQQ